MRDSEYGKYLCVVQLFLTEKDRSIFHGCLLGDFEEKLRM